MGLQKLLLHGFPFPGDTPTDRPTDTHRPSSFLPSMVNFIDLLINYSKCFSDRSKQERPPKKKSFVCISNCSHKLSDTNNTRLSLPFPPYLSLSSFLSLASFLSVLIFSLFICSSLKFSLYLQSLSFLASPFFSPHHLISTSSVGRFCNALYQQCTSLSIS